MGGTMARTRHDGCPRAMDDGLVRLLLVMLGATAEEVKRASAYGAGHG